MKRSLDKKIVKELLAYTLCETEEEVKKWKKGLCRDTISGTAQVKYISIISECIAWIGSTNVTQKQLQNKAQGIISDYLHFDLDSYNNRRQADMTTKTDIQLIAEILIHAILQNEYDAITRTLLIRMCRCLQVPIASFQSMEKKLLQGLHILLSSLSQSKDNIKEKTKNSTKKKKWLKVAATSLVAGTVCAVAAPLLLPLSLAAIQSVGAASALIGGSTALTTVILSSLTATASFLSTTAGLTVFTTGIVAHGAITGGKKMYNSLDLDVKLSIVNTTDLIEETEQEHRENEIICIQEPYDVVLIHGILKPDQTALHSWGFHSMDRWYPTSFPGGHTYLIDWEQELLTRISSTLYDESVQFVFDRAKDYLKKKLLYGGLGKPLVMAALTPIQYLDDDWVMVVKKAKAMGAALAYQLLERESNRPLNLVAYSMGCLVITSLLETLYKEKQFGYIQDVILLGCPHTADIEEWGQYRQVVSGRFVNGYSTNDGMLCYLHRMHMMQRTVAGLQPIEVDGIENCDLSSIVKYHSFYAQCMKDVLEFVHYTE